MKELFIHHLKALTRHEANLVTDIAYIESKLDLQEAKDGYEKVVFSPEWIKGKELSIKMLKLYQELQEKKTNKISSLPIDAEIVEFNKAEEEKKHMGEGDMYIPPPKVKPVSEDKVIPPPEPEKKEEEVIENGNDYRKET